MAVYDFCFLKIISPSYFKLCFIRHTYMYIIILWFHNLKIDLSFYIFGRQSPGAGGQRSFIYWFSPQWSQQLELCQSEPRSLSLLHEFTESRAESWNRIGASRFHWILYEMPQAQAAT